MKYNVISIYPESINDYKKTGIIGRNIDSGIIKINSVDLRDYSKDKHKRVDDYTYGGGAGMLLRPQPVYDSVMDIKKGRDIPVILFSPKGKKLSNEVAKEYAKYEEIILLCGHYEGIDQRAVDLCVDEEISIGDYILTGGHIASMVFIDAVSRYIPGVLGNEESLENESFENNLLEYPQYTRPIEFMGMTVPEVLTGGNHKKIEDYRLEKSIEITRKNRPDLLK